MDGGWMDGLLVGWMDGLSEGWMENVNVSSLFFFKNNRETLIILDIFRRRQTI